MSTDIAWRLRERVTVARQETIRDSSGLASTVWIPVLTGEPAEVLTGAGKESAALAQAAFIVAGRITLRYRQELAAPAGYRVQHGTDIYHVETWYRDATNQQLITLQCSTGGGRDGG